MFFCLILCFYGRELRYRSTTADSRSSTMKLDVVLTILYVASILKPVSGDGVYSSTQQISALLYEDKLQDAVKEYIQKEERKLAFIKSRLAVLQNLRADLGSGLKSAEHPIGVYSILRAYMDINDTVHNFQAAKDFKHLSDDNYPTDQDMTGAALSIVKLRQIFGLSATDLINGNIGGESVQSIGPYDTFHIAKTAYDYNMCNDSLVWLNGLVEVFSDGDIDQSLYKDVLVYMFRCYIKIPDVITVRRLAKILNQYFSDDPAIVELTSSTADLLSRIAGDLEDPRSDLPRYKRLCRGDNVKPVIELTPKWQICQYRQLRVAYIRVKEEILSITPHVVFYHDVISDYESETIKTMATKELQLSKVGFAKDTSTVSNVRVSKTAWLWDTDSKIVNRISQRISLITGLSKAVYSHNSDGEPMQIVNYGIGGQYEPHLDSAPHVNHSDNTQLPATFHGSGDRIATFLMYLSDVRMGGSTVFPRAGLRVDAIKNGAVFWYNMLPSGEYDLLTLHAGCPVVLGQKWIANKWFRTNGQMFRRPCGLSPEASQHSLVKPRSFIVH